MRRLKSHPGPEGLDHLAILPTHSPPSKLGGTLSLRSTLRSGSAPNNFIWRPSQKRVTHPGSALAWVLGILALLGCLAILLMSCLPMLELGGYGFLNAAAARYRPQQQQGYVGLDHLEQENGGDGGGLSGYGGAPGASYRLGAKDTGTVKLPLYQSQWAPSPRKVQAETLVVYVFAAGDEGRSATTITDNLRFFREHGMWEGDGCDYLFIIQEGPGYDPAALMADLPRNARWVSHENSCYDWGTLGWAVQHGFARPEDYKYLVLMNSSVRGPFLTSYWPRQWHWSRVLTQRLNNEVKLVGPTVNCEGAGASNTSLPHRQNPHIQSYVVAMDQVGYRVLRDSGTVFNCYKDMQDVVYHSEIGSGLQILQAGYNLDSLMIRYQGVDWRDQQWWACNAGLNPYMADKYDGINLNPLEVMFVKVKAFMLDMGWEAAVAANKYAEWLRTAAPNRHVSDNHYIELENLYKRMKIFFMQQKDPSCFDYDYYRAHSAGDLAGYEDAFLWQHFVYHGQFEPRPWRLVCDDKMPDPFKDAFGGDL